MSHLGADTAAHPETDADPYADPYADPDPGADADWAAELAPRRPARRRLPLLLAALVLAALGFVGGIVTTQQVEESQQASGLPEGLQLPEGIELPEGFELPSGGLGGGLPGGGAGAGQLAALTGGTPTYTVTVVDGGTLYLKDTGGTTVKAVTVPSTKVRRLAPSTTDELRPGDTVTVTGETDDTGQILAERIDQTR